MTDLPPPPRGVSRAGRELWLDVLAEYDLSPADVKLLREACWALHRADEARIAVSREGMTYLDRFGAPRQHPAAALELRHREAFVKCMRELRLDGNALPDPRPPRR
jgi:hypothetical protein